MFQTIVIAYSFMGTLMLALTGLLLWAAGRDGERQCLGEQARQR